MHCNEIATWSVAGCLKAEVEKEVKVLQKLKADYLGATGQEWKPGQEPPAAVTAAPQSAAALVAPAPESKSLHEQIVDKGNKVRDMKAKKAAKVTRIAKMGRFD